MEQYCAIRVVDGKRERYEIGNLQQCLDFVKMDFRSICREASCPDNLIRTAGINKESTPDIHALVVWDVWTGKRHNYSWFVERDKGNTK